MSSDPLAIRFHTVAQVEAQIAHAKHGGLFVPAPDPVPDPLTDLAVVLVGPGGEQVDFRAQVVQVTPAGLALIFDDASSVQSTLAKWSEASGQEEAEEESPVIESSWRVPQAKPEEKSQTLYDRIKGMSVSDKRQLGRHGGRAERLILMKDVIKDIHTLVIQNPRITLDEVRYMAAFPQTNAEVLVMISKSREWTQNPGILTALVRNPKTPATISVRILDRLPEAELRRLAKSNSAPRAVSEAARRKVIGNK